MLADAIQSGAEDDGVAHLRVKQRFHAKMIPRAEQALARPVPYGKCEITKQVLDTFLAPGPVGPEQQFNVGHAPVTGSPRAASFRIRSACASTRASATIHTWPSSVNGWDSRPDSSVARSSAWPKPTLPSTETRCSSGPRKDMKFVIRRRSARSTGAPSTWTMPTIPLIVLPDPPDLIPVRTACRETSPDLRAGVRARCRIPGAARLRRRQGGRGRRERRLRAITL